MLVDLGALDDFPDGDFKIVKVDGLEVGVVHWRGKFYALLNRCPDQDGPLCRGSIHPFLGYDEQHQAITADEGRPIVSCPWHFWQFDVANGRGLRANARVKTYPVVERSGRILLDIGR